MVLQKPSSLCTLLLQKLSHYPVGDVWELTLYYRGSVRWHVSNFGWVRPHDFDTQRKCDKCIVEKMFHQEVPQMLTLFFWTAPPPDQCEHPWDSPKGTVFPHYPSDISQALSNCPWQWKHIIRKLNGLWRYINSIENSEENDAKYHTNMTKTLLLWMSAFQRTVNLVWLFLHYFFTQL